MIKRNKKKTVISSIVILLPMLFGLVMWDRLPELISSHWGTSGETSRIFAVFVMPLSCLVLHFICLMFTGRDPGNRNQTKKAEALTFCIAPMISLYSSGMAYAYALGMEFDTGTFTLIFLGVMFIAIGNILPKCRRNSTLGIKVTWALHDDENWNKTHRFGGTIWVIGGVLMLMCVFLPGDMGITALLVILIALIAAPTLYSYLYYRKQQRGEAPASPAPATTQQKQLERFSGIFVAVILIAVVFLLFTGNIEYNCGEESFTASASYWRDMTVRYDSIDTIEYADASPSGTRTNGLGSPRLLVGSFRNDEFGSYTRYTYTNCPSAVVLTMTDGRTVVLSGKDDTATRELYSTLLEKVS